VSSPDTLVRLFAERASALASKPALKSKRRGEWQAVTWEEWDARARAIATELVTSGIEPGDRVAIFASTREEWVIVDLAVLMAGAVTVPIYQTLNGEQAAYILSDSGARVLFAEDAAHLTRIADGGGRAALDALVKIVVMDDPHDDVVPAGLRTRPTPLEELLARTRGTRGAVVQPRIDAVRASDLATIIYTSGTTGPPKGAMLTHENLVFEVAALGEVIDVGERDEQLLFLPMAHIFAKVLVVMQWQAGYVTTFAESITKVLDNAGEVNPTFMGSVPRLYEKIFAVANDKAEKEGKVKRGIFDWAIGIGRQTSKARQKAAVEGKSTKPEGWLGVQNRYATKLVLSKIRARFGTRLRFAISGGAPLAKELAEWFDGAGVPILEAYGLTETTGGATINSQDRYVFGTVGPAVPGVELKLASDGEVLIRGKNVMRGYWNKEADTREVIDADGWIHSGDIGVIDAAGFLTITDRKKDIIVTAGGKNVAPQNIENLLKQSPWLSQAMVHGDKRAYLVALVTLDPDAMARFATETGRANDPAKLADDADVRARVEAEIDAVNKRLSQFETIKKFRILPRDFTIEGGELTPTLKVKRKVVSERHRALLDAMYDG
jgi:long-chain acyl-CoA synthetase